MPALSPDTICSGQTVSHNNGCGETTQIAGTKTCTASLGITGFTPTSTVTFDNGGCNSNRCYYQTTIANSGSAEGKVGKLDLIYNGAVIGTKSYNEVVPTGQSINLVDSAKSDCYISYSYEFKYYDNNNNLIGSKSFTCYHP